MAGRLYGVGVGPGVSGAYDSQGMQGDRRMSGGCSTRKDSGGYGSISDCGRSSALHKEEELLGIHMPMTKNKNELEESHREAVRRIREQLDHGRDVAFLTLGDPTVYSTYLYVHEALKKAGYPTEIVSGIPSFCAAAARLQTRIAEKAEQIHIIPASYQIQDALNLPGTKILMKAGRQYQKVKEMLAASDLEVKMVENCGMEEEHIYQGVEEMPKEAGYYTLIFVKERGEKA